MELAAAVVRPELAKEMGQTDGRRFGFIGEDLPLQLDNIGFKSFTHIQYSNSSYNQNRLPIYLLFKSNHYHLHTQPPITLQLYPVWYSTSSSFPLLNCLHDENTSNSPSLQNQWMMNRLNFGHVLDVHLS
jgi:hypothetical protein